ncbi:MAG: DNA polymerase III subunit alpha [Bradymonadales bacterium]|nr:MAG: DNA polymerase III subunit alpha [Bradymonadales bacterium]
MALSQIGRMLPLRLHTDFSLLRSMIPVESCVRALKEGGYSAGAITDFDCGFGWADFFFKMKSAGLKPILGTQLQIPLLENSKTRGPVSFLILNHQGYRNLSKILTSYSMGSLSLQRLIDWQEGLVLMLSPQHPQLLEEKSFVKSWQPENAFLEIHKLPRSLNPDLSRKASRELGLSLVATQAFFYLKPEDHFAHEVLMSIGQATSIHDDSRPKLDSHEYYFRSKAEMEDLFADEPEAMAATQWIADRVDFQFQTGNFYLPQYAKDESVDELFARNCQEGLNERLELVRLQTKNQNWQEVERTYRARLDEEIQIIQEMKFPGYFLIVADFIQWSKNNGIPVGPGRGSGAGSLAAYCLKITDIDPIRYNLLFERFLNPERVSMPDFDVDFCIKGRDRVIQYVRDKYNLKSEAPPEDRLLVSQIITYGKMKSKAVIRDVGRALGMPYQDVDAIARLVPPVLNINLEEAYQQEPEFEKLRERDPKADQLLQIAEKLEGMNRHTSVHAAGVVIADKVLTSYLPLLRVSESEIVCQFEMKAVEKIGLVKFDFLGLRNLTVIQECLRLVDKDIDLLKIDYNDPKVMAEISTGETTGIFQLESSGMRDVIRRLQPSVFEDLIAIVALYRPGPLEGGMVDDFILRKRGQKPVTYPVPQLEEILKETYGVFVYQEQVMGTANLMAGFSLGEADLLRRAMGKKIAEEMAKQREKFVEGAVKKSYDRALAQKVFDLMSEFAKYGFNKSHAAAYAMITFQTAYLKTYYPEAFYAALLSSESDDIEKIGAIIRVAQRRACEVKPPHVNFSREIFSIDRSSERPFVRFGLAAIKNLGENVAKAIVEERDNRGPFKDYSDFFHRMPSQLINRRQAECLIRSGALDSLGLNRASLLASLESLHGFSQATERARQTGQVSLFKSKPRVKEVEEWNERIRLNDEKHLLGTYTSGHPLNAYATVLSSYRSKSIQQILQSPAPKREVEVLVVGLITNKKEIMTKKGHKMAFIRLEDMDAEIECVIFSDLYQKKSDLIVNDRLVTLRGQVVKEEGVTRLLAREISDLSVGNFSELHLEASKDAIKQNLEDFRALAQKYPGDLSVKLRVPMTNNIDGLDLKSSAVMISTGLQVQSHPELINWIQHKFGKASVSLH